MIEACITGRLLADPAVSALMGTRIYPDLMPEGAPKPAATYRTISTVDEYDLDGATGKSDVRLEFNLWGSALEARQLARAVRASLDDFSGPLTSPLGNCDVLLITRDGQDSGYDSAERCNYVQQDWMIQFTE